MKKEYNEPKYINVKRDSVSKHDQLENSKGIIKELCDDQAFGVLATQGNNDCYNSLISFAVNENYTQMVFATPIDTKKLDLIKKNSGVSVLIDNRNNNPKDINDIVAATIIGEASILSDEDKTYWSNLLIEKHSYLETFIEAPSTVIVKIEISKYYFVGSFQEVIEWSP